MSTTTRSRTDVDHCVELTGISWPTYSALLRSRGERPSPRMTYLDGKLWLMSPSYLHERIRTRLGTFVTEVAVGLGIRHVPTGQTTFRRRGRRGGVEGDQTYYFAHAEAVRGKSQIDLRTDPPPDLAIEVVHTHGASEALATYRRLRVPEVWVGSEETLRGLILGPDGRYVESTASAFFPFLTATEILAWVQRPDTGDETEWVMAVREWVRDELRPQVEGS